MIQLISKIVKKKLILKKVAYIEEVSRRCPNVLKLKKLGHKNFYSLKKGLEKNNKSLLLLMMKIKFKVSVVVCAKNEEKRIVSCLKSISKNKVDEIILVDGNSSDNTVKLAKKFIDKVIISKRKLISG